MASLTTEGQRPELVVALVGASGTRLEDLAKSLKDTLTVFGYRSEVIKLSSLLTDFHGWTADTSRSGRTRHLQDMGDLFRRSMSDGAALALAAIVEIRRRRVALTHNPDTPAVACAYILHQLKHPDEARLLRRVYGAGFYLVAGHSPRVKRVRDLGNLLARDAHQPDKGTAFEANALEIIERDEKSDDIFGQNTRDTYPLADFYANLGISGGEHVVGRFVELLFGHPFHTPQPDEYAMYQASSAALRSSDDKRQVGAVIANVIKSQAGATRSADIIAVGMNEVPHGGGGFYWDQASPDNRDQALLKRSEDRSTEIKISALEELLTRIKERDWLQPALAAKDARTLSEELVSHLRGTQFMDIGEFSRPVHAEMAALIDAARRGVAVYRHFMYTTTFPCHNCAKHIIAAGIARLVYLEPYPKSRANVLHREELELDSESGAAQDDKLVCVPFTGIAPRQYRQLFDMAVRRGKTLAQWEAERAGLAPLCAPPEMYTRAERLALAPLLPTLYQWDINAVCPAAG
jgi:deoxycytidylate deaminase